MPSGAPSCTLNPKLQHQSSSACYEFLSNAENSRIEHICAFKVFTIHTIALPIKSKYQALNSFLYSMILLKSTAQPSVHPLQGLMHQPPHQTHLTPISSQKKTPLQLQQQGVPENASTLLRKECVPNPCPPRVSKGLMLLDIDATVSELVTSSYWYTPQRWRWLALQYWIAWRWIVINLIFLQYMFWQWHGSRIFWSSGSTGKPGASFIFSSMQSCVGLSFIWMQLW